MPCVIQAEPQDFRALVSEASDYGIVRVHHERRVRRECRNGQPPPLGEELELSMPVELITEKIREHYRTRACASCGLGERSFVDLEETELRASSGDERRSDSRKKIGAGLVPGEPVLGPEDSRSHRRGRRLPVGRRDEG